MEDPNRLLGNRASWLLIKAGTIFALLVLAAMVLITARVAPQVAFNAGVAAAFLAGIFLFAAGKYASVRADTTGIYVQRWRKERFIPWPQVSSVTVNVLSQDVTLQLRKRVGGYTDVVIADGLTTPAGVSAREYWATLRGKSVPETILWIRAQIAQAQGMPAQNAGDPLAG